MNKKKEFLFLLLSFFVFFELTAQKKVVISGTITNYKEKAIAVAFYEDYLDYERRIAGKTVTDKNGNFALSFDWERAWPAFLILENETMELFLTPNDSLFINGKYKKLAGTSKFSGSAAYANTYLSKHLVAFTKMRQHTFQKQKKMKSFEKLILHDTMYYREMKAFDTLNKNIALEFHTYMHANIEYYYANKLFLYNLSRSDIESRLLKIECDNEDALNSMYYLIFLENYLNFITEIKKNEVKGKIDSFWNFQFDLIKEKFSGRVMDILLARLINRTFNYTTIVTTRSLLNKYYNVYKNQAFYKRLESKLNDKSKNY